MDRTLELGYTKGAAILVTILLCMLLEEHKEVIRLRQFMEELHDKRDA